MRATAALILCGVMLCGVLSSCGWFNDDKGVFVNRNDDYLDSRLGKEIELPNDMQTRALTDPFPIPDTPPQQNPVFYPGKPPLPNTLYANDNRDQVRVQKLGTRQWLVIPEPADTVWPKVKQFMAENAVGIAWEDALDGRLDTEWLVLDQDEYKDVVRSGLASARGESAVVSGKARFQLRLEQGMRDRTSEIHVRHDNENLTRNQTERPRGDLSGVQSDLPSAESGLLQEIGAYVAAKVAEQTVSRLARSISTQEKARVDRDESGLPVLRLNVDYQRAWAAVGQALAKAEVDVTEEDGESGVYGVRVSEATFLGEGEKKKRRFRRKREETELELRVANVDDAKQVVTVYQDGERAERELSRQLLNLIRDFAS